MEGDLLETSSYPFLGAELSDHEEIVSSHSEQKADNGPDLQSGGNEKGRDGSRPWLFLNFKLSTFDCELLFDL
jgi:hypothetical protein